MEIAKLWTRRAAFGMRGATSLFHCAEARAAHFLRDVLHLRQPVLDSQPRLLIVNMDPSLVRKVRNHRGIDVGKSHAGMLSEEVASALFAPFAITVRRLVVTADVVCSERDAHRFGFP